MSESYNLKQLKQKLVLLGFKSVDADVEQMEFSFKGDVLPHLSSSKYSSLNFASCCFISFIISFGESKKTKLLLEFRFLMMKLNI